MIIRFLMLLGISILLSALVYGIYHLRFKKSLFIKINSNVSVCVFIIAFGVSLFSIFGFNIFSIIIIPVLSLTSLYILIRNAIAKLLNTSQQE